MVKKGIFSPDGKVIALAADYSTKGRDLFFFDTHGNPIDYLNTKSKRELEKELGIMNDEEFEQSYIASIAFSLDSRNFVVTGPGGYLNLFDAKQKEWLLRRADTNPLDDRYWRSGTKP